MNKMIDYTKDNKCSNCGSCCTDFLPLYVHEIRRIREYIEKHNIKEQHHNFMQGLDITCPFRDDTNKKCLIYEVRPSICRTFICSGSEEKMLANKTRHEKGGKITCMRTEFFKSNTLDAIQSLLQGGNL